MKELKIKAEIFFTVPSDLLEKAVSEKLPKEQKRKAWAEIYAIMTNGLIEMEKHDTLQEQSPIKYYKFSKCHKFSKYSVPDDLLIFEM